jgi:hypothetical protein
LLYSAAVHRRANDGRPAAVKVRGRLPPDGDEVVLDPPKMLDAGIDEGVLR